MRKKVCGIIIMSALKISSTSGNGPSSGSVVPGCVDVDGRAWSESPNLSSKPLSRINRHFSSSGISTRGFCSVGDLNLFFRFFDMDGSDKVVYVSMYRPPAQTCHLLRLSSSSYGNTRRQETAQHTTCPRPTFPERVWHSRRTKPGGGGFGFFRV